MTTLIAKLDDKFIKLPELNKYLGRKVIITINDFADTIGLDEKDFEVDEETLWLKSISNNPAFDFLKDNDEDIYTIHDGEAINA